MSHHDHSWRKRQLRWTLLLIARGLVAVSGLAQTACYATPDSAIDAIKPGSSLLPTADGHGYRITGIQLDPVLGHGWAKIVSCDHPDWPVISLQVHPADLGETSSEMQKFGAGGGYSSPVVHVGDVVRLWKQENLLRIEATGISEENGSLGKTIRVRLRRSADGQPVQEHLFGVVRGPSDVEMQP